MGERLDELERSGCCHEYAMIDPKELDKLLRWGDEWIRCMESGLPTPVRPEIDIRPYKAEKHWERTDWAKSLYARIKNNGRMPVP